MKKIEKVDKMAKNSDRPVHSRMQIFRMARIVALLKKNRMPSAEYLLREYEKLEFEENLLIRAKYNIRTVYRDIAALKADFNCPIEYDHLRKGYYLTDRNWELNAPAQLSESAMLALVLGARIAEDIFPDPLKSRIANAVDEILKAGHLASQSDMVLHSLKVFAESGAVPESEIFPVIFESWQKHRAVRIVYDDLRGGESTARIVEPQVLFLYARQWRIKAYCRLRGGLRTFVIDRIKKAELLEETFLPDHEVIDAVDIDNIVSWKKLHDIRIKLTGDAVKFAAGNLMHSQQSIEKQPDGTFLLSIPEAPAEVLLPWIFTQQGEAIPLAPAELVELFKARCRKLAAAAGE